MYLSAPFTQPGTREIKSAWAGMFLHAEQLNIKAPRPIYIFDE
jgi:hypothetical protein